MSDHDTRHINIERGSYIEGKVSTGGGDFVGGDQVINNITNIQQAISKVEEREKARSYAEQQLLEAVKSYTFATRQNQF